MSIDTRCHYCGKHLASIMDQCNCPQAKAKRQARADQPTAARGHSGWPTMASFAERRAKLPAVTQVSDQEDGNE